jgi:hypothetical protein
MFDHIRDTYFPQITLTNKDFEYKSNLVKLPYLLGEVQHCDITETKCVTCIKQAKSKQRATSKYNPYLC